MSFSPELPQQVFRIDQTDYMFNGVDACEKSWDKTDTIPCGLTEGELF